MRALRPLLIFWLALPVLAWSSGAQANEPPPPPPPPPKKVDPPGLTGNKLPQCPEGQYVASMICKPAPPGYFLEHGMKYPKRCPEGTTSPAGAKAQSYCRAE